MTGIPGGASARPPQGRWGPQPPKRAWRFPRPQRGGETGKGLGEKPKGSTAAEKNGSTHRGSPRKPPSSRGGSTQTRLFPGALGPRKKACLGPASKGRRGPKRGRKAHTQRHSTTEGTTRKMTEELTEARGALPPQHPSQGQPAYLPAALYTLDLGVINGCQGAVIFRHRRPPKKPPSHQKGGRYKAPFWWLVWR